MMGVIRILNLLKVPQLWRYVGFMSSVIGLVCYALSSSFFHLFGEWNLLKIILYVVGSFIICTFMLFAKKWQLSSSLMLKAHVGFLVLMVTSVYSFFYDKAVKGKTDVFGLVSCGSFAFMSFSLSRQIDLGFEVDLLNFFLGCLTVQLMKINLILASVGALFCYFLILLRSSLDSQAQQTGTVSITDHVVVQVGTENGLEIASESDHGSNMGFRSGDTNHQQKLPSLRKSSNSGFTSRDGNGARRVTDRTGTVSITDHIAVQVDAENGLEKASEDTNHQQKIPSLRKSNTGFIGIVKFIAEDSNRRQELASLRKSNSGFKSEDSNHRQELPLLRYRKRKTAQKLINLSPTFEDGHSWRKYGQKHILGSQFPRNYYRCPQKYDQGCQATKQVQRIQENPDMYQIAYFGLHTCKASSNSNSTISSSNSNSTIEQEYPKGDTPSDLIYHKLDPSMASNIADPVYSCTNSQNSDVDFGKDEASSHNSSNNEDKRC